MPIHKLLKLATELSEATDQEDWSRVSSTLAQIKSHSLAMRYKPADKGTLIAALEKINTAVDSSTKRKTEIGELISKLSDSPV